MNKRQKKKFYQRKMRKLMASVFVKYTPQCTFVRKEDITPQIPKKPEGPYVHFEPRYLILNEGDKKS